MVISYRQVAVFCLVLLLFRLIVDLSKDMGAKRQQQAAIQVARVIDGDTFIGTDDNGESSRYRLAYIDAPELTSTRKGCAECYGVEADSAMFAAFGSEFVRGSVLKKDRYGRTVIHVDEIERFMLSGGFARVYRDAGIPEHYYAIEDSAKALRVGMWGCDEWSHLLNTEED